MEAICGGIELAGQWASCRPTCCAVPASFVPGWAITACQEGSPSLALRMAVLARAQIRSCLDRAKTLCCGPTHGPRAIWPPITTILFWVFFFCQMTFSQTYYKIRSSKNLFLNLTFGSRAIVTGADGVLIHAMVFDVRTILRGVRGTLNSRRAYVSGLCDVTSYGLHPVSRQGPRTCGAEVEYHWPTCLRHMESSLPRRVLGQHSAADTSPAARIRRLHSLPSPPLPQSPVPGARSHVPAAAVSRVPPPPHSPVPRRQRAGLRLIGGSTMGGLVVVS